MKFATLYSHIKGEDRPGTDFTQPGMESMTQQSDAEDADINVLLRKYKVGGMFPQVTEPPKYGDFTNVGDYRSAVEAVNAANQAFMEVPAEIRARFNNDPAQFIKYAQDEKNLDQMVEWGLAEKPPMQETTVVPVGTTKETPTPPVPPKEEAKK